MSRRTTAGARFLAHYGMVDHTCSPDAKVRIVKLPMHRRNPFVNRVR